MCLVSLILEGVQKDCKTVNGAIGVDKDLILVNYVDFDREATMAVLNREADDTNKNIGGLTAIKLKTGAVQHIFEGTDYSVIPNVAPEVKEDGDVWYIHNIGFTVYNKTAKARKTLEALGGSKVIGIVKDRSTGLFEIFGIDQGLRLTGLERAYVGAQNSNFYTINIATPDIAVIRETTIGELALSIETVA